MNNKNRKIKISVIAPNLSGRGGTETVLSKVMNYGGFKHNFQWELLLPDGHVNCQWINSLRKSNYLVREYNNGRFIKALREISFLFFSKSDLIICLGPKTVYLAHLVRKICFKKFKIISWIHFDLDEAPFLDLKYLVHADMNLAISSRISNQLMDLGIGQDKILTVYNPVQLASKKVHFQKKEPFKFVYLGRMEFQGQKNLKLLIDTFTDFPSDFKYELHMVGTGKDINKLQRYAQVKDVDKKITWHGWVEHPWDVISSATALVLSSQYEGFPMVLVEALSHGVPVIASNVSGTEDIIQLGVNGFTFDRNSERAMSNSILRFVNRINDFQEQNIIESVNRFR
ncbi:MAG: glycosyltransferase, partial [Oenococcus sp.]|uniref:glycosyltransferase n=1 Tax=Oenococcus sp. TaxID=1979414 RepID=UPI0039EC0504